ncbi:MAG: 2'-5' RNA ligase family protein [bacterium]|nr:2'-5' RNA ligase family protein [bacterium]
MQQKFSQKYTIITLLEDMEEGTEFPSTNWPLHVTIADTFAVDWGVNNLREKLSELAAKCKPFKAKAAHDEYFGPEKQTQVTILDMSKELVALHHDAVALLKSAGAVFNDPQYTEGGFRAHATVQSHARLNKGDTVAFENLAIVNMFPNEDPYQRKIMKILRLSGK